MYVKNKDRCYSIFPYFSKLVQYVTLIHVVQNLATILNEKNAVTPSNYFLFYLKLLGARLS